MYSLCEKTDLQIQQDVKNEFQWDPSVSNSKIEVTAKDGVVTLRGRVPHYFEKCNAENVAQRVDVLKVKNNLKVTH
ncbi:MAG: BON domain-containing protein [Bdellovibrionaceae bacterium]|nr:BON domain-containing protein [Bdellovibrio sp.]